MKAVCIRKAIAYILLSKHLNFLNVLQSQINIFNIAEKILLGTYTEWPGGQK